MKIIKKNVQAVLNTFNVCIYVHTMYSYRDWETQRDDFVSVKQITDSLHIIAEQIPSINTKTQILFYIQTKVTDTNTLENGHPNTGTLENGTLQWYPWNLLEQLIFSGYSIVHLHVHYRK